MTFTFKNPVVKRIAEAINDRELRRTSVKHFSSSDIKEDKKESRILASKLAVFFTSNNQKYSGSNVARAAFLGDFLPKVLQGLKKKFADSTFADTFISGSNFEKFARSLESLAASVRTRFLQPQKKV